MNSIKKKKKKAVGSGEWGRSNDINSSVENNSGYLWLRFVIPYLGFIMNHIWKSNGWRDREYRIQMLKDLYFIFLYARINGR